MSRPKVMTIVGTRPEAIKMAPVIARLGQHGAELDSCVVATAQHRSMLDEVLDIFGVVPDHDLDVMKPGQSLAEITVRVLEGMERLIVDERPGIVLVQGDTTSAFVAGLAAFYNKVAVGHVEAGLRTHDKYNPFPEEMNRHLLDGFADLCLTPTASARQALLDEGVPESRILVTGNTVVDALLETASRRHAFSVPELQSFDFGRDGSRTLLVTSHRRESFGEPMENVCLALRDLLDAHGDLRLVFPVHLNPNVQERVYRILGDHARATLLAPLGYLDFVHLMRRVDLIVSDSGGVQEEAPSLDVPVLVIRETTERPEAVEAGATKLIGTDRQRLIDEVTHLLSDREAYARMQRARNPFGDGQAAGRTVDAVRHFLGLIDAPPAPFAG